MSVQAVVGVVVVSLLGWLAFRLVDRGSAAGDCAGGTVTLEVAAAPDIAPVLTQAGGGLTGAQRHLGAGCYAVRVSAADPARVEATLAGQSGDSQPHVWVPDSSYWLARARAEGARGVPDKGTSVASSPVVLALSKPLAQTLGWPNAQIGWDRLLATATDRTVRIGIPDPVRSPVGVSALLAVIGVTAKDGKPGPATVAALRQLSANVSALSGDLFGKLPQAADPVSVGKSLGGFPATEQSIAAYDGQHPVVPAVPVYPRPATPGLDYPYAPASTLAGPLRLAADRFLAVLQGEGTARELAAAGFRSPSGGTGPTFPTEEGLSTDILAPVPLPASTQVAQAVGLWTTITLPSRLLSVVDVSGSMNQTVPGTDQTRLQVTINASLQGLGLFSDDSEIGLWIFSTDLGGGRDYRELVPIGPLSTQRAAMAGATARIQVKPNGATGLYDTVLAAYQRVSRDWDPARSNAVTVFTDGENEDPHGISRATLLAELARLYDPNKPVRIIFLGLGPDVNAEELAQIAKVTHGLSFVARDPTRIRDIFLEALAVRPCQPPNC